MRHFKVKAYPYRVEIEEVFRPVDPRCRFSVDGVIFLYAVTSSSETIGGKRVTPERYWRDRAYTAIYYHAKNAGTNVFAIETWGKKHRRETQTSDSQLTLPFDTD